LEGVVEAEVGEGEEVKVGFGEGKRKRKKWGFFVVVGEWRELLKIKAWESRLLTLQNWAFENLTNSQSLGLKSQYFWLPNSDYLFIKHFKV
jgi:hypothetical protein